MWLLVALSLCVVVVAKVSSHAKSTDDILADWQPKINSYDAFFAEDDTQPLNTEGYPRNLYMVSILSWRRQFSNHFLTCETVMVSAGSL